MEDQKRYDWEPSVRKIGETAMLPETAWQEEWQVSPDCESFAAVSALEDGTFTVRLNDALWETRTDKMYNCQFAPDGRLTALSQSDGEWAIVVDDAESEEHADYLWGTRFNHSGAIAVPMQTGMEYGMLVNGTPWERLYTAATDFVLSETGKTAAIVQTAGLGQADLEGFSKGIYTVAVDGEAWEECYLNAWSPCFDREGHRVASTVRVTPYEYTISINGQRWSETYPCAWEPVFEPKSGDVIAPIRKEGKWGLARNGSLFWKPVFAQCWSPQAAAVDGGGLRRPALCEHGLPEEGAVAGEPPLAFLADGRDDVAGLGLKNGFPRAGVGFAPALAVDGNGIFVRRDAHGAGDAVAFPVKTGRPRVQVALFPCLAVDGNRIDALAEAFQIGLSEPGGLDDCGGFAGFRKDEIGGGGVEPFPRRAVDQHAVFHTGLHGHGDGPGVVEPGSPQIVGVFFAFRVVDHNGPLAVALGQGRQPPVGGELAVIHLVGARFPQRIVQAYGKSAVFEGRNRRERFAVRRNLPFLLPCRFGQHRRFPDLSDRRFPIIPFLIFHTVPHWV